MRLRRILEQTTWLPLVLCFGVLPLLPFLLKASTGAFKVEAEDKKEMAQANDPVNELRFALLASLDLLIRAERTLQKETGSYVSSLGRVPDVLGPITTYYRIDISRASSDRFLVAAVAAPLDRFLRGEELQNLSRDAVSVDENFHVRLNFPMPQPPPGYLKAIARAVLVRIQQTNSHLTSEIPSSAEIELWEGIFKGHFKYEVKSTSSGARSVVAKPHSEVAKKLLGSSDITLENHRDPNVNVFSWMRNYNLTAFGEYGAKARLQQIYLGQKIIFQDSGRYEASLEGVVPAWNGLAELLSPKSMLRIDEFSVDATLGYQAEIALYGSGEQIRNLWSINAFGQVSQTNPVEELMGRFEKARKVLEPSRRLSSETSMNPLLYDKISDSNR